MRDGGNRIQKMRWGRDGEGMGKRAKVKENERE